MKVRRRPRDVSQRRSLEGAGVFRLVGYLAAARIGFLLIHADTDIVILLIGKQDSIVAVVALDRLENIKATIRAHADRCIVAGFPTIPRRVAADDRSFERRNRLHHVLWRGIALKNFLKLCLVSLQRIYLRGDLTGLLTNAHVAAFQCGHGLCLERAAPAIPVKLLVIADVPKSRTAAW